MNHLRIVILSSLAVLLIPSVAPLRSAELRANAGIRRSIPTSPDTSQSG